MADTASAAPSEREQFERYVKAYTGRDIEYHERNGTTGLEFGWACWQVARAHPTPLAVVEPLTKEQRRRIVLTADTVSEAIDMVERHHGIKGGQHDTE